jgi:hypothetical protein
MDFERTEFSDATYGVVGRALTYAQRFEADCKALRLLVEATTGKLHRELFGDEESWKEFIDRLHGQPLYGQIRNISQRLQLPGDIDGILQAARDARNAIAHEVCLGIQHDIETDVGRDRLVGEISRAVRHIVEGHLLILIGMAVLTNEQLPAKHYINSYCDKVVEWVSSTED